jgi:hypothetical protein
MPVAAWTDALLALAAGLTALALLGRGSPSARTTGIGLLLVALAASVGTLRLSGQEQLAFPHDGLSAVAAFVGLPLVGTGWATAAFAPTRAATARVVVLAPLLAASLGLWHVELLRTALGGLGMGAVLVASTRVAPRHPVAAAMGAGGALLTVGVGLGIGTQGELMGFPRIGWFHLGLAAGSVGLGGVLRLPDPSTTS